MIGWRWGTAAPTRSVDADGCEIWDLDGGRLPDGRALDESLTDFRAWVDAWSTGCTGGASCTWHCPASWRGAAAAPWIERGARIAALGCALKSIPPRARIVVVTRDPVLGRLARRLVGVSGQLGDRVRVIADCTASMRLRSRLEPLLLTLWWILTSGCRLLLRRRVATPGSLDLLLLEPLVAGAMSPTRHNWGDFDPTGGRQRCKRIEVPIGFGLRIREARRAAASIPGAALPEDLAALVPLLKASLSPMWAVRSWPREAVYRGVDLAGWSRVMRHRLCVSTTLQAAAFVHAAVLSLRPSVRQIEAASCWFENQPQERAFTMAVRAAYPECAIDGFLLFHFAACSHGAILPTHRDHEAGCIPDIVHCCGSMQRDWLSRTCPWVSFVVGPAGRFPVAPLTWSPAHQVALIVLPSLDRAAVPMIDIAAEAAHRIPRGWVIRIRAHPANGAAVRERARASALPLDLGGSLEKSIAECSIVAGAGSSGVVLARAMGWPVTVLAPDAVPNMDPFPPGHGLTGVSVATRADEFVAAINAVAAQQRPLPVEPSLFADGSGVETLLIGHHPPAAATGVTR